MEHEEEKPPSRRSWKWQLANAVRSIESLKKYIPLSEEEEREIRKVSEIYPLMITPYYLSLIKDVNDPNDPIRKQCIPDIREIENETDEDEDPLCEERDSPVEGITHRYPDRVLVTVTNFCPVWCRHCTRKRIWKKIRNREVIIKPDFSQIIHYIESHPEVRDVILSGGDPLTLSTETLRKYLSELRKIQHVEIIRIGTRVPVTLPQRLDDKELLSLFEEFSPIWINTHFNHPAEITQEAAEAIKAIRKTGTPVNNQTVLLKGVNDSVEIIRELVHQLLKIQVRPYYLYHCDPSKGVSHFRTSLEIGLKIVESLRGYTSGLANPLYVVDGIGGKGKIPIMPEYLVSYNKETHTAVLRNYKGELIEYRFC